MKPELQQIESAARNLADYLRDKGDEANMRVVSAQVELIQARLEVAQGVRSESGSLVGG